MSDTAKMTIRYRLQVAASLEPTRGNCVYVGLDVKTLDEVAPVLFAGLPRRIQNIRDRLVLARTRDGHRFPGERATARDLIDAMHSPQMAAFAPLLEADDVEH